MTTQLPLLQEIAAVTSAFVIKPIYMVMMAYTVYYLHKRADEDLGMLKCGVGIFLLGEIACAVNFTFFKETSALFEAIHGFGMIVGLGIIILGFLILIDNRIVFLTDKERPCVMIRICRQCIKKSDAACGLERLFLFATLSLAILNLMPLISPLMPLQREVIIFGSRVCQWSPEILQILEFRIYPLVGFILFIASFFILLAIKETPARYARYTFSLGMGFLFFPLFQYILLHCYYDRMVWSAFWEELTELMLASGILIFLWVFPGLAKKQNEEKLC